MYSNDRKYFNAEKEPRTGSRQRAYDTEFGRYNKKLMTIWEDTAKSRLEDEATWLNHTRLQ
eukprot:scaffold653547_cov60-Prasinocladus_malaysianus.AAC.1